MIGLKESLENYHGQVGYACVVNTKSQVGLSLKNLKFTCHANLNFKGARYSYRSVVLRNGEKTIATRTS